MSDPALELTVGVMPVLVFGDTRDLAMAAAQAAAVALQAAVETRGRAHAMFATGNSQVAFFDELTARSDVPWPQVVGFHLDEYCGLDEQHPASFRRYLRERLVDRVPIGAFHGIRGDASDPMVECDRYTALLADHPLDLCCLGIGENGHLAFNDPPVAEFADTRDVKVVALDEASRRQQVGEGHFPSVDLVPTHAITVTIPALLRAPSALAIVPEARKREPVRRALYGPVSTECPASILRQHPNVTLFLDRDSAAGIKGAAA